MLDKEVQRRATMACRGLISKPRSWEEFLDVRYSIPHEYLVSYQVNFAPRPPPPLDLLLPQSDFSQVSWSLDTEEMITAVEDVRQGGSDFWAGLDKHIDCQLDLLLTYVAKETDSLINFHSNGFACPDIFLVAEPPQKRPLIVAFMNFDQEGRCSHLPQVAVNRLYHYMQMTGTYFGAVTCLSKTWISKRVSGEDGRDVMFLSPSLDQAVLALTYVITLARQYTSPPQPPRPFRHVQEFEAGAILHKLEHACRAVNARHTDKILAGIKLHEDLQSELEGMEAIKFNVPRRSCMAAVRGNYKGRSVVVKSRDLTSPWGLGFRGRLKRLVKEVDAYLSMRWLQGKHIPELVEWGFFRGAMFGYVMTSDCGRAWVERVHYKVSEEPWVRDCPAKKEAIKSVISSLLEVHKRGILHGDIERSKVVLKKCENGDYRGTLVGFAQMKYFDTAQSTKIYEEGAKLQTVIDELMESR